MSEERAKTGFALIGIAALVLLVIVGFRGWIDPKPPPDEVRPTDGDQHTLVYYGEMPCIILHHEQTSSTTYVYTGITCDWEKWGGEQ